MLYKIENRLKNIFAKSLKKRFFENFSINLRIFLPHLIDEKKNSRGGYWVQIYRKSLNFFQAKKWRMAACISFVLYIPRICPIYPRTRGYIGQNCTFLYCDAIATIYNILAWKKLSNFVKPKTCKKNFFRIFSTSRLRGKNS